LLPVPLIKKHDSGTHEPVHWSGEFAEGLMSLTKWGSR
jgi:hypothetical protein